MPWEMVLHSRKLLGMEESALNWVCGSFLVSDCGQEGILGVGLEASVGQGYRLSSD